MIINSSSEIKYVISGSIFEFISDIYLPLITII